MHSPRLRALPALTLAILGVGSAHAASFLVDIQSNGNNTENGITQFGWNAWELSESFSSATQTTTFAYADAVVGTATVSLIPGSNAGARNYGLQNVSDPGNLTIPNVWLDQYFFNNNAGGSLTVRLDDLTAGTYQFTSYHYADNLDGDPGVANDEGTANVSVDTGGGPVATGLAVHFVSGQGNSQVATSGAILASELDSFGTLTTTFTVANDSDTVDIIYGSLSSGDSFGLNGFEVNAIPEPTTGILAALGTLLLLRRRR